MPSASHNSHAIPVLIGPNIPENAEVVDASIKDIELVPFVIFPSALFIDTKYPIGGLFFMLSLKSLYISSDPVGG